MAKNYIIKTLTFQGKKGIGEAGINGDTYLSSGEPNAIKGLNTDLKAGIDADGHDPDWAFRTLVRITNITKTMKISPDDIVKMTLGLYIFSNSISPGKTVSLAASSIDEGEWSEIYTTWNNRLSGVPWEQAGGKSTASKPFFSRLFGSTDLGLIEFNITSVKDKDVFDVMIHAVPDEDGEEGYRFYIMFHSCESSSAILRPIFEVKYRDWSVEAFDMEDSKLTIVPNKDNPEYPTLRWGRVDNWSAYTQTKIYRKTEPFSKPSEGGTPVHVFSDITVTEWTDTSALSSGQQYFYMVSLEGTDHLLDDSTYSNIASFSKPIVSGLTLTPSGLIDVGTEVTASLTSTNFLIKKVYINWGDGSYGWHEFETADNTKTVKHIYPSIVTNIRVSARVEDSQGFRSESYMSSSTITTKDKDPIPILIARPLVVIPGDTVVMNARLSHPIASNEKISWYHFWNGSNWIISQDPVYSFTAPAKPSYPSVLNLKIHIKTSGGLEADSDYVPITIESPDAIKLEFSKDTKITSRGEKCDAFYSSIPIYGGVGEIDISSGVQNIVVTLDGISSRFNLNKDLNVLRDAVRSFRYVKVRALDEICGKNVVYYGRIVSYSVSKTSDRLATWSANMRVMDRKENESW